MTAPSLQTFFGWFFTAWALGVLTILGVLIYQCYKTGKEIDQDRDE